MFNEREVVADVLAGDLKAFGILVKQYEKLVFYVINRLIREKEDVEDVCQEVFIKVYRSLGKFAFESKLSTWIARIAYLSSINHLKKYKNKSITDSPDDLSGHYATQDNPEQVLVKKDVSAYVHQLIAQMPEQYGVLLTLYHLNGFSYQEIEEITSLPEGTVKSYLFRARKLLKEKLEAYLKDE